MIQMLVKNGVCASPTGRFLADIAVADGTIAAMGTDLDLRAETTVDAEGRLVLPGIVDGHVHLPWPSGDVNSADDLDSGTTAAVCGGVTSVVEYVVPDQSGRILPALDVRLEQANGSVHCDYGAHLILRKVTAETLEEMAQACARGFPSFKIYTAYEGFRLSDQEILQVMHQASRLDALVCLHAEDDALVTHATERLVREGKTAIEYYPQARPQAADISATDRVISYAGFTGARVHIVHVNTGAAAALIRQARENGLPVTGETCPHYLMFTEDVYRTGTPEAHYFVMAPVLRGGTEREALWSALATGGLQSIATDHAPYTSQQKLQGSGDFRRVPGGVSGIESSLALLYTYGVRRDRFPIERLVEVMSTNPARIFGLFPRKGILAVGSDADLVIYDETGASIIDSRRLHSRTDHTVHEGVEVLGRPVMTILRGTVVARDGELVQPEPTGRILHRAVSG